MVPFTNGKISSLWTENEHWERACSIFGGKINSKHPQIKRLQFEKKNWMDSHSHCTGEWMNTTKESEDNLANEVCEEKEWSIKKKCQGKCKLAY